MTPDSREWWSRTRTVTGGGRGLDSGSPAAGGRRGRGGARSTTVSILHDKGVGTPSTSGGGTGPISSDPPCGSDPRHRSAAGAATGPLRAARWCATGRRPARRAPRRRRAPSAPTARASTTYPSAVSPPCSRRWLGQVVQLPSSRLIAARVNVAGAWESLQVVGHHPRGFPVAGEHYGGSRRAAAGELARQTYPSGVGGHAALEAGGLGCGLATVQRAR